jgi:PHD/YefM family antitoxin component YafN of YafNO toxin-antitoxin module
VSPDTDRHSRSNQLIKGRQVDNGAAEKPYALWYAIAYGGNSMGIPKIKSVSELRKDLYSSLKEVSEGATQVVTHKQGEPVVLISQSEFNKLSEENLILRNLEAGLADIRAGRIHSTKEVKNKLIQKRKERDSG